MDTTREIDLKQLYEAKVKASNRKQRETIEKTMYNIEKQSRNPEIAHTRERLINAHKNNDVESTYMIEEQLREMERYGK